MQLDRRRAADEDHRPRRIVEAHLAAGRAGNRVAEIHPRLAVVGAHDQLARRRSGRGAQDDAVEGGRPLRLDAQRRAAAPDQGARAAQPHPRHGAGPRRGRRRGPALLEDFDLSRLIERIGLAGRQGAPAASADQVLQPRAQRGGDQVARRMAVAQLQDMHRPLALARLGAVQGREEPLEGLGLLEGRNGRGIDHVILGMGGDGRQDRRSQPGQPGQPGQAQAPASAVSSVRPASARSRASTGSARVR